MNREKGSAVLDCTLVTFRFVFRNAKADKRADNSAYCSADPETGESSHDWTCGDKWADTGDSQGSDASQQSQSSADDTTCSDSGRGAFRGLCALLMGESTSAFIVREKDGYRFV